MNDKLIDSRWRENTDRCTLYIKTDVFFSSFTRLLLCKYTQYICYFFTVSSITIYIRYTFMIQKKFREGKRWQTAWLQNNPTSNQLKLAFFFFNKNVWPVKYLQSAKCFIARRCFSVKKNPLGSLFSSRIWMGVK